MTTFNRDEFRVQLLLALPDAAFHQVPGDDPEYLSTRRDPDYNAQALAAFVLEQLDAAVLQATELEAEALPEVASMAAAAGTASASAEFAGYLEQLAGILKRNMGISEQWDLARTISGEAGKLRHIVQQLVIAHPGIAAPVSNEPLGLVPASAGKK